MTLSDLDNTTTAITKQDILIMQNNNYDVYDCFGEYLTNKSTNRLTEYYKLLVVENGTDRKVYIPKYSKVYFIKSKNINVTCVLLYGTIEIDLVDEGDDISETYGILE